MILFLTSSPCDNHVPSHMHLPFCYFEKNEFVNHLKKYWKQNSRCLIISASPTQFDRNNKMLYAFQKAFLYHGMIPEWVKICDARNDYHAADLIKESDVIILGGGHVPTQMTFFEAIGLRELLKDYQGIVMGISAGSMNCAETVYAQPEEPGESVDPDYKKFFRGLELTKYQILPHYQKVKDTILDGKRLYEDIIYADSKEQQFYALPDASYILQTEEGAVLYGEAFLIQNGEMIKICEDGDYRKL